MKKTLSFLACMLLCFCFLLSGCTSLEMPATDGKIVGNGGTVVQKGEYIYFANAYTGYSSLSGDVSNKTGKAGVYSLYRAKVDAKGSLSLDEDGFVDNAEVIVSKVVGFEYSDLYIVGDYLYFSSPNMHKTSSNENRFDLISIFKVKLDGTGLKEIYTTQSYTSGDWGVVCLQDKNYILVIEDEQIVRFDIDANGEAQNKTVLASDITSAVMSKTNTFANDKFVYFTTERNEDDQNLGLSGNLLKSVDITNGNIKTLSSVIGETITLQNHTNNYLVYTKNSDLIDDFAYVDDFAGNKTCIAEWCGLSNIQIVCLQGRTPKIVCTFSEKLVSFELGSYIPTVLVDGNATVIQIADEYVYYTLDNTISRISLISNTTQDIYEDENMATSFDFDGHYLYLFSTVNSSSIKYMGRIDLYGIEQNTTISFQTIGAVNESDKTAED